MNAIMKQKLRMFAIRLFHILQFPNPTGLFTKPTGCHYTKYRFSPDIAPNKVHNS